MIQDGTVRETMIHQDGVKELLAICFRVLQVPTLNQANTRVCKIRKKYKFIYLNVEKYFIFIDKSLFRYVK